MLTKKAKTLQIRLDDELLEGIKFASEHYRLNSSDFIRRCLGAEIARLQESIAKKIAFQNRHQQNKGK